MSKVIFPTYYKDFHCIAGLCRHTCCRDWEIDIDKASLERFAGFPDITSKISDGSYVLDPDGRCPFLMEDGLCYQIKTYGEDFICDICKEHPRYYFTRNNITYGGISLACEEAARLILTSKIPFELEGGEAVSDVIRAFNGDPCKVKDKIDKLSSDITSSLMRSKIFAGMEILDETWETYLNKIGEMRPTREQENAILEENETFFANFITYMLYRYEAYMRFAAEASLLLADLMLAGMDAFEAARMFSSEVEYSDINIEEAKSLFGQEVRYGN